MQKAAASREVKTEFPSRYPRHAFDQINEHVQVCLRQNLRRRSQRTVRPPEGVTDDANFPCLSLKFL